MINPAHFLQETLHREIPLTKQMAIKVQEYTGQELLLHADLAPNINVHGTAFGGSLYSVCAIACWGFLHLKSLEADVPGEIVLGEGHIKYHRPLQEDILVRCSPLDEIGLNHFITRLKEKRKAALVLNATVEAGNERAVSFTGHYFSRV